MDKEAFLISRLRSKHIGDDAAVIGEIVYSADAFCEGTHFRREWMSPAQIGRKAMLVNLSDAVAMNADPLYALVTVMLPREMPEPEIAELAEALEATATEYGCEIIGGDTVGGDALHLSITLISRSENPLPRRGVSPGDLLAYTGTLGESKRDLERLICGEKIPAHSRFYEPVLRREFVSRARPRLRAGMDISDGLYCDVNKLLDLNGLGLTPLKEIPPAIGESGEEYEMLVAFPPECRGEVERIAQRTGTPLTTFAAAGDEAFRYPCRSHHF
jgi:thiamine-monophosphate kinase